MRRSSRSIALACAAALSLALGGPGSALAGTPGSDGDAAVPARVEVPTCTRGPASADRTVVFRGETQPIAGSLRMAMRFTLLERVGSGPPMPRTDVRAMRSWRRSRAGVRRFGYSQRVAGLRPGADYSALVQFRWTDANGHLVRRARRVSVVCSQREPVVNLAVAPVSVEPGRTSGTAVYTLRVTNAGGIAARSVGA